MSSSVAAVTLLERSDHKRQIQPPDRDDNDNSHGAFSAPFNQCEQCTHRYTRILEDSIPCTPSSSSCTVCIPNHEDDHFPGWSPISAAIFLILLCPCKRGFNCICITVVAAITTIILWHSQWSTVAGIILIYPCTNAEVWAVVEDDCNDGEHLYPCVTAYRRLQWHHPQPDGPLHSSDSITIQFCDLYRADCSFNDILNRAITEWSGTNVSCWIHNSDGALWSAYMTPSPDQIVTGLMIAAIVFVSFLIVVIVLAVYFWRIRRRYYAHAAALQQHHRWHSLHVSTFLMGLHRPTPSTPLYRLVNDPLYDPKLSRLIGTFIDATIDTNFRVNDSHPNSEIIAIAPYTHHHPSVASSSSSPSSIRAYRSLPNDESDIA